MRGAALLFLNRSSEVMSLLPEVVPVLEETDALESLAYALHMQWGPSSTPEAGRRVWGSQDARTGRLRFCLRSAHVSEMWASSAVAAPSESA